MPWSKRRWPRHTPRSRRGPSRSAQLRASKAGGADSDGADVRRARRPAAPQRAGSAVGASAEPIVPGVEIKTLLGALEAAVLIAVLNACCRSEGHERCSKGAPLAEKNGKRPELANRAPAPACVRLACRTFALAGARTRAGICVLPDPRGVSEATPFHRRTICNTRHPR